LFLNTAAKRFFARERPFGSACAKDPEYTDSCEELDRFRSYYSGHAAITATGAGLTCSHHTHLPLYGGGVADLAGCLVAVTGTLTTGVLRIAADRHWATDVMTGHIIGFGVGYLLPTLLYYKSFEATPDESTQALAQPQLRYSGTF
jgi:membrane-associated phospholipid phosphatase